MLIGYARISTTEQNLDLQIDALKKAGCERIITDEISGVKAERKGLQELMNILRKDDEVIVWRLDRLGRSIVDIHNTIKELTEYQVCVVIVRENIKTLNEDRSRNSTADLLLSIMAAVSQLERDIIRERVSAGVSIAKASGKYCGRKKGTSESPYKFLSKPSSKKILDYLRDGEYPISHIAKVCGVSRMKVYKVKRMGALIAGDSPFPS